MTRAAFAKRRLPGVVVGVAAAATAVGEYVHLTENGPAAIDAVTNTSLYLATWIGGITATGSVVAFGKLNGNLGSAPLQIAGRDQMNMAMGAASLGAFGLFLTNPSPERSPKSTVYAAPWLR